MNGLIRSLRCQHVIWDYAPDFRQCKREVTSSGKWNLCTQHSAIFHEQLKTWIKYYPESLEVIEPALNGVVEDEFTRKITYIKLKNRIANLEEHISDLEDEIDELEQTKRELDRGVSSLINELVADTDADANDRISRAKQWIDEAKESILAAEERAIRAESKTTKLEKILEGKFPLGPLVQISSFSIQRNSYVYYMQRSNEDIKIGYSNDVVSRKNALEIKHGALGLLAVEPGGEPEERLRHDQFGLWRISRPEEWFHPSPYLLTHITCLQQSIKGQTLSLRSIEL